MLVDRSCFVEDLLAKLSQIRSGAEKAAEFSRQRYIDRLTWLRYFMKFDLISISRKRNYERIVHALETLKLDNSNGTIRKQPFCILLTGPPGCGKSRFAVQVAIACLRNKYGSALPSDIVTLNETDEFQSEFRTSHKVVIFDDLGAERFSASATNPWRKIIDFVNNVRKTSLNPNVEMKGNVYIEPDLVIITTNLKDNLDIPLWMNAPGAIFRRLSLVLYLHPDFKTGSYLHKTVETTCLPNVFDRAYSVDTNISEQIDRQNLIFDIRSQFVEHMIQQERFVLETNSLFDEIESNSIFKAFYNDILYPILPKKTFLPKDMEKLLSWDQKFWRCFAVTDGSTINIPLCSSIISNANTPNYQPQNGTLNVPTTIHFNKRKQFLYDFVDWRYYEIAIRDRIVNNNSLTYLIVYKDVFVLNHTYYSWKTIYKEPLSVGLSVSVDEIEEVYSVWSATTGGC